MCFSTIPAAEGLTRATGSNNGLDSSSATAFATALAAVTSLTSLDMRCAAPRAEGSALAAGAASRLLSAHGGMQGWAESRSSAPRFSAETSASRLRRHAARGGGWRGDGAWGVRRSQDMGDGDWAVVAALLPRAAQLQVRAGPGVAARVPCAAAPRGSRGPRRRAPRRAGGR